MGAVTEEALALAREIAREYGRPLHAEDRRLAQGLIAGYQRLAANIEPAEAAEAAPEFRALVARIGRAVARTAQQATP